MAPFGNGVTRGWVHRVLQVNPAVSENAYRILAVQLTARPPGRRALSTKFGEMEIELKFIIRFTFSSSK